jgi:hypothetical protein
MSKTWKDLRFIKQIVIKPEDAKNPMWVEFKDDIEYAEIGYMGSEMILSRDRAIRLGANTMYMVEMDYPEDFKKLVVATGDTEEAYRIYQQLQKKVPDNWANYAEENVW